MRAKKKSMRALLGTVLCASVLVSTTSVVPPLGYAQGYDPEVILPGGQSPQSGEEGEDYVDTAPPALTDKEIRQRRLDQERAARANKERRELERLEGLGFGNTPRGGGGGGSSDSDDSGGSEESDDTFDGEDNSSSDYEYDGAGAIDEPVEGAGEAGVPENAGVGAPNPIAHRAVAEAVKLSTSGKTYPYQWGGHSPETSFDCSGFTGYVYSGAGMAIPSVAQSQDYAAPDPSKPVRTQDKDTNKKLLIVDQEDSLPGDLLIWKGGSAGGHVALVLVPGAEGDNAIQESGDPNKMGPFRLGNMAGQGDAFIVRPTVLEDGSPAHDLPELTEGGDEEDTGDEDAGDEDTDDSEDSDE